MKTVQRDENDPVGGPAQKMCSLFETALVTTLAGMKLKGLHHTPDHLYVATMAISGAIQIAGKLMTMPENCNIEDEKAQAWANEPLSRIGTLVACLLVARCVQPDPDKHGIDFGFGPKDILAAIKAAEQLVGHNIDHELTPGMVKAARRQQEPTHLFDNTAKSGDGIHTIH